MKGLAIPRLLVAPIIAGLLALTSAVRAQALVVVGNSNAKPLTREEIAAIYLGRHSAVQPLDVPAASATYEVFYRRLTGRNPAQVRAAWAAIVFTGRGKPPQVLVSAEAVKRTIAAQPNAIGYIEKSELDSRVRALLVLED